MKQVYNIALVIGSFHRKEAEIMLDEARKTASQLGLNIVEEVWVHGSLEKPLALKRLLIRKDIDGAVALGVIEKGETKHGFVMGVAVVKAIIDLQLEFMKPIGVGILGPEIEDRDIPVRLRPYAKEAVIALEQMLSG